MWRLIPLGLAFVVVFSAEGVIIITKPPLLTNLVAAALLLLAVGVSKKLFDYILDTY